MGRSLLLVALPIVSGCNLAGGGTAAEVQVQRRLAKYVTRHYVKREVMIPMRDGVKLFTAIYEPKDRSRSHPILMKRTPYSVSPYGEDAFPASLGPSGNFSKEGYIFVYQDVRGCFMSEGSFVNMTPHLDDKESPAQIDESSDTYDTIEWLLKNIPNHNGRVGLWGISYPGFYVAAGIADAHPAIKAASPQAPIADWFFDDFHHHGAFFLPHAFNFLGVFGKPRPEPTKEWGDRFEHPTPDGYRFFLDLGPLTNVNKDYYHDDIAFWNEAIKHPDYDTYWQSRNLLPHLRNVAPAVMTVGGWFDAEDLYGTLQTYRAIEQQNPGIVNTIVMGPWAHGGWSRRAGDHLGHVSFDGAWSAFYQEHVERRFFNHYLKGDGALDLPEAYMFETGANRWRSFDQWPPAGREVKHLYFHEAGRLSFDQPDAASPAYDEYVSDPAKPVPFTEEVTTGMPREYMTDDQRFASRRPDVLAYQTDVLEKPVTLAGPVVADLWVSTSGTASDWVVKLIDVFPPDAEDSEFTGDRMHMGDYQMMVRSEVIRGRYRNSYEHPEPFVPNEPTRVRLPLQDVLHTFGAGHRIMIQIQSTWFPLVDRNPQSYVDNVYLAEERDFIKATQRVYRGGAHQTRIEVGVVATAELDGEDAP